MMHHTIIGIDAGLRAPGFAVIKRDNAGYGRVLFYECFIPNADKGQLTQAEFDARRIEHISARIIELVKQFSPTIAVVELPTGGGRGSLAIRGMAYSTATAVAAVTACRILRLSPLELKLVTPLESKKSTSGVGRRKKGDDQSKWDVLSAVSTLWPDQIQWPMKKRKSLRHEVDDGKAWAIADALSAIATYVKSYEPNAT